MIQRDCFAYGTDKRCNILKEVVCIAGNCEFYKTKEQHRQDFKKYPPLQRQKDKESKSEWNRKKSGKPVIIRLSIHIGDCELILGEMENAPQDQTYLVAYCNRTELWDRYEECLVSDDFIEVAEIYADRLKEQVRQVKDAHNKIPEDKYVYCMSEKDRDNFLKRIESETIKTINKGLGAAKKRRKERIDKFVQINFYIFYKTKIVRNS